MYNQSYKYVLFLRYKPFCTFAQFLNVNCLKLSTSSYLRLLHEEI